MLGGLSTAGHVVVFMPLCDGCGRQVTYGIAEELLLLPMTNSAAKPRGAWHEKKGLPEELARARYEIVFDPGPMMLGLERLLAEGDDYRSLDVARLRHSLVAAGVRLDPDLLVPARPESVGSADRVKGGEFL